MSAVATSIRSVRTPVGVGLIMGTLVAVLLAGVGRGDSQSGEPFGLGAFSLPSGNEVYHFATLAELTAASDLVVLGTVTDVVAGAEFGRADIDRVYYAVATLRVADVVVRAPTAAPPRDRVLYVDFFLGGNSDIDSFAEALRGTEGMWFLKDKAADAERLGLTGHLVDRDRGLHMLAGSQGLVIERDGKTVLPLAEPSFDDVQLFEATMGRALGDVVADVRSLR